MTASPVPRRRRRPCPPPRRPRHRDREAEPVLGPRAGCPGGGAPTLASRWVPARAPRSRRWVGRACADRRLHGTSSGRPDPHGRTAAPGVPGLRLGGHRPRDRGRRPVRREEGRQARQPGDGDRGPDAARRHRPRPHPVGDPRSAERPERPPPRRLQRRHHGHPQRIIENFRELRDGLEARGHVLVSETDTEALAHLVEEAYAGDLAAAVRAALAQCRGALCHRRHAPRRAGPAGGGPPQRPLVVGLAEDEAFLASDVAAILAHTSHVIFLGEGDVADLRPAVTITDVPGVPRERPVTEITWSAEAAEKGGFEHFMLRRSTSSPRPAAVPRRAGDHGGNASGGGARALVATLRTISRVELVACGTASYASLVGPPSSSAGRGCPPG